MTTLRRQLLVWLIGGMLLSILVAGVATYHRVSRATAQLFDFQLAQIAANLPTRIESQPEPPDDGDPDNDILIQIWDDAGHLIYPIHTKDALLRPSVVGLGQAKAGGRAWRTYSEVQPGRLVLVSQPVIAREKLAAGIVLTAILPFLALVPVLAFITWLVVGNALRPVSRAVDAVKQRSPDALQPVPVAGLPAEVRPLLDALNDLFVRLDRAIKGQRAFIADAAHELRSPLTALKLQLQLTERAVTESQRATSFVKLHERLDRTTHLIQQLLILARHDSAEERPPLMPVVLQQMAQAVVSDLIPLAEHRSIQIKLALPPASISVLGDDDSLRIMLSNLIDNALRYTPPGGLVRVALDMQGFCPVLVVADNGPGIPPAERERVFDRFYRYESVQTTGSGLGLAIVRRIAEHHQCAIQLSAPESGTGLVVSIRFPAAVQQ